MIRYKSDVYMQVHESDDNWYCQLNGMWWTALTCRCATGLVMVDRLLETRGRDTRSLREAPKLDTLNMLLQVRLLEQNLVPDKYFTLILVVDSEPGSLVGIITWECWRMGSAKGRSTETVGSASAAMNLIGWDHALKSTALVRVWSSTRARDLSRPRYSASTLRRAERSIDRWVLHLTSTRTPPAGTSITAWLEWGWTREVLSALMETHTYKQLTGAWARRQQRRHASERRMNIERYQHLFWSVHLFPWNVRVRYTWMI